jgi:hypothetical protein
MFNRPVGAVLAAVLILAGVIFLVPGIRANPELCTASSVPEIVGANSDVNFQFTFTNTDPSTTIDWITITTPTSTFNVVSDSANGWNAYIDGSGAEFTDGALAPGDSLTLNVEAQTGPFVSGEIDWGIYGYGDSTSNGPGVSVCQNNTPTDMVDNTPYISDVTPSDLSANSVLISWTTSLPATSQVDYGLDDTYGSASTLDSNLVTNHSVTLSGLASNTGYHYQVESTDPSGGDDVSGDNTFLTALAQAAPPSQPSTTTITTNTKSSDKTPPGISLDSATVPKLTKTVPTISGTASDNDGVVGVDYSTDGGMNWLPVDSASNLGTKSVDFSFTPVNLADGTYYIEARATDTSGNTATTAAVRLVISRVPPQIGGSIITVGPQVLQPNSSGLIEALVGVDQKITVHSIGGPTTVDILSQQLDSNANNSNFELTKDPTSGLWSGVLSFAKAGTYELTITSINGAGQKTTQYLQTIEAVSPAKVISATTKDRLKTATATLYYKDVDSGSWVVWDGPAYGEQNPQTTKSGNLNLLIPPGTYYLKITAAGYRPLISRSFSLTQSLPLTTVFALHSSLTLNLGLFHLSLPSFSVSSLTITPRLSSSKAISNPLVGRAFPNFSLASTTGSTETELNLYGKPTIVAVLGIWSPTTVEQLSVLSGLQQNPNINVVPIFVQDSLDSVSQYLESNGYSLTALADPIGTLVQPLQVGYLPTYYFLDQSGNIKKVTVGVLSGSELQTALVGQ